ncbi:hypothetical protein D3C78_702770 [compost metagenome]
MKRYYRSRAGILDKIGNITDDEYISYLDGDILGKLIFKNFLINIANIPAEHIHIPAGRFGKKSEKYKEIGEVQYPFGDGHVDIGGHKINFEIKLSRLSETNKHLGRKDEYWAFSNTIKSSKNRAKNYDLLIAIGINVLDFGEERRFS